MCLLGAAADASAVSLSWDQNPEPDIAGYTLSYGTSPGQYIGTIDVGNTTTYQFSEPNPSTRYYLALRAYNTAGLFSGYSNEVSTTPAAPALIVTGLSANRNSPQPPGTTVTFSAIAGGGVTPYQFKWWIVTGATSTVGSQWSASNTFNWTPASGGNYTIRVWARNASSTADAPANSTAALDMTFTIIATGGTGAVAGVGSGLMGQYFNDSGSGARFTTLAATRTDATMSFNWATGTPGAGIQADNFSVRWTGQLLVLDTAKYTFSTLSDDGVRLWINGELLIDNWTDHGPAVDESPAIALTAGMRYDVLLEYYEAGSWAVMELRWTRPGQPTTVIPTSQLFPAVSVGITPGLAGQYYNDSGSGGLFTSLATTRTDAAVNFNWAHGTPGTGIQSDNFSVRWIGEVLAPVSGNYTFSTLSDDGVRLWVNGLLLIDNWTDHGPTVNVSPVIALTAGLRYDVRLEYYEKSFWSVMELRWTPPGQATVVVPAAFLSH